MIVFLRISECLDEAGLVSRPLYQYDRLVQPSRVVMLIWNWIFFPRQIGGVAFGERYIAMFEWPCVSRVAENSDRFYAMPSSHHGRLPTLPYSFLKIPVTCISYGISLPLVALVAMASPGWARGECSP